MGSSKLSIGDLDQVLGPAEVFSLSKDGSPKSLRKLSDTQTLVQALKKVVKAECQSSEFTPIIDEALPKLELEELFFGKTNDPRTFVYALYKANNSEQLGKIFGLVGYTVSFDQILTQFGMLEALFKKYPHLEGCVESKLENKFPTIKAFINGCLRKEISMLRSGLVEGIDEAFLDEMLRQLKQILFKH